MIERRPDAEDRRALRIYLTEQGRKTLACLHDVVDGVQTRIEREFFADYTPEQRTLFLQMLTRVREACA